MLYKLFIITILSFIVGQLGRFDLGNGIILQITDLCVFLLVFVWFIQKAYRYRKGGESTFGYPFIRPFMFFCLVGFVSLIVNSFHFSFQAIIISSLYLVRWAVYGCIFFVVQDMTVIQKKNIWQFIIASGICVVILGFIQYIFYPNLIYIRYLGWDDHLYRLFSTLLDPNFAAVVFSLLLFMISPQFFVEKNKKNKLMTIVLFIVSLLALLLTYSRSGYVMFASGSIATFILLKKRLYLVIVFFLLIVGIFFIPKNLHSAGVELWRTASITARSESAQQALRIIVDHPILGIGFSTYRYAQLEYGFTHKNSWLNDHAGAGTDNSWLFVMATTGVVGLLAYLYLWYKITQTAYKVYKKSSDNFQKQIAITLIASFVGLAINALFINSLFFPTVMFWMWVLAGINSNEI